MELATGWFRWPVLTGLLLAGQPVAAELSFQQRVGIQRAVERAYHSHRIGSAVPFEQAVSNEVLEDKVRETLRLSLLLERRWGNPLTSAALERELQRIAARTRAPERLNEIYAALGNDPHLVLEGLARPTLVRRLSRNFFAYDDRIHAAARSRAEALRASLAHEGVRIEETHDAFAVVAPLDGAADGKAAVYRIAKTSWDAWWAVRRMGIDLSDVRTVAADGIVFPAPDVEASTLAAICPTEDLWNSGELEGPPSGRFPTDQSAVRDSDGLPEESGEMTCGMAGLHSLFKEIASAISEWGVVMSQRSFFAILLLFFVGTAAAEVTVDTTVDGNDGECLLDCTIREAVDTATAGETVVVPAGTYTVSLGAITVDKNLAIIGDGAHHTILQHTATPDRLFLIAAGASVEISSVTLSRDPTHLNGGGIGNGGDLLLRECWLRDGFLTHQCCGGALHNGPSGTVTVERCTMSGNVAEFGGAVLNEGSMFMESSTISGNSNTFEAGGILDFGGGVTLSGCTVVGNEAVVAGVANISGIFVLRNTVVGNGVNGPDCAGTPDATAGYNLDTDGTCLGSGGPGNSTADPLLGPLVDNGGPVPTHEPGTGSPLIDAGNPATPGSGGNACAVIDARGVARPQGTACDIGAFELATGQDCAGGAADDADGDGVCRAEDNCPAGFNPGQGPVVFPHAMRAATLDTYTWDEPEDVSFVRGDLSELAIYGTNDSGDLTAADSLTDTELPVAGSGFYYLVRLGGECTVGSWQTRVGGQPGRDASLP